MSFEQLAQSFTPSHEYSDISKDTPGYSATSCNCPDCRASRLEPQNTLTSAGRDVLGFFRVLKAMKKLELFTSVDWMRIHCVMETTSEDALTLSRLFLAERKVDNPKKPEERLTNVLLDLFTEALQPK